MVSTPHFQQAIASYISYILNSVSQEDIFDSVLNKLESRSYKSSPKSRLCNLSFNNKEREKKKKNPGLSILKRVAVIPSADDLDDLPCISQQIAVCWIL